MRSVMPPQGVAAQKQYASATAKANSSRNSNNNNNNNRGAASANANKKRTTRAGNDLDFPFEKLSVGGAEIAKLIISPLADPSLRAIDPRDATGNTVDSSSEDSEEMYVSDGPSVKKIAATSGQNNNATNYYKHNEGDGDNNIDKSNTYDDEYYTVTESPAARRFSSPSAKTTESLTYSSKYMRDPSGDPSGGMRMEDLPASMPPSSNDQKPRTGSDRRGPQDPDADVVIDCKEGTSVDYYYEVEASPVAKRSSSPPPPKSSRSITYSSKYSYNQNSLEVADLPESMPSMPSAGMKSVSAHRNKPDSYYDVEPSPAARGTSSVTYSTQFVRDPNYDYGKNSYSTKGGGSSGLGLASLPEKMPSSGNAKHDRNAFASPQHRGNTTPRGAQQRLTSPDPEAKHISDGKFVQPSSQYLYMTSSASMSEEGDSYYEVFDSPRADGTDDDADAAKNSGHTLEVPNSQYSSYRTSSKGWISDVTMSMGELPESTNGYSKDVKPLSKSSTISSHSAMQQMKQHPGSGRSNNNNRYYNEFAESNRIYEHKDENGISVAFSSENPIDPEGQIDFGENYSTTGESLVPTPDDVDDLHDFEQFTENSDEMHRHSKSSGSPPEENTKEENEEEFQRIDEESVERSDPESQSEESSATTTPKIEHSPFPSKRLLVFMVIVIFLCVAGLVGGLTYYLWEKKTLDPIRPPTAPTPLTPRSPSVTPIDPIVPPDDDFPLLPDDTTLKNLFSTVVGDDVFDDASSAGMAANWMLYDDPAKTLKIRSKEAWIQRYLLVYTYYATTMNRSTSWLSCNPSMDSDEPFQKDERNIDSGSDSGNACRFAYPTELPGGRIIYDLVPSSRWLSEADECQWGGVACHKTIMEGEFETSSRLAVTSIVLADQYLKGSIVTELAALPELEVLDLSHNGLRGQLHEDFRSLKTLRLQYNNLSGSIPSRFFDDKSTMRELNVGSNQMTGTIPSEVGLSSQMANLYIFENNFSGSIPVLGKMPLINFHAQSNDLKGMLPFDFHFSGPWPETLREWWVYDNQLSGPLSESLGFLSSLEDLRANNNQFSGSIPDSIGDLQRLFRFDVQSNYLTGTVPTGIGDLPELRDVRVQFNSITGVIPTSLCFLESMEVLEADCLPGPDREDDFLLMSPQTKPEADCFCCTTCCNAKTEECIFY